MMNKALQWLYDNWMKATPFLAVYSAILIWMYVKDVNYALFLIWMQIPIYRAQSHLYSRIHAVARMT